MTNVKIFVHEVSGGGMPTPLPPEYALVFGHLLDCRGLRRAASSEFPGDGFGIGGTTPQGCGSRAWWASEERASRAETWRNCPEASTLVVGSWREPIKGPLRPLFLLPPLCSEICGFGPFKRKFTLRSS